MAAHFPGDRVAYGEPDTKATGGEFVGGDDAVRHDEPCDGRTGCGTVRFERVNAGGVVQVSITGPLERVRDRLSNPSGFDTSLPSLEPAAHAVRIGCVLPVIQGFFGRAGMCRGVLLKGVGHPGCLRASLFDALDVWRFLTAGLSQLWELGERSVVARAKHVGVALGFRAASAACGFGAATTTQPPCCFIPASADATSKQTEVKAIVSALRNAGDLKTDLGGDVNIADRVHNSCERC